MHRLQNPGRNPRTPDGISPAVATPRYRGRFAPSPTGPLHLGSLLAALASWLDARSQHGIWLLRIEDVDPYRSDPHAAAGFAPTLERFGLYWDETILYQSQRLARYRAVLDDLDRQGWLYACDCSRKRLAEHGYRGEHYPNTCRPRAVSRTQPHALRLMTPDQVFTAQDRLQAPFKQNLARELGDFILYRRDHAYAYHLAVVVDDHDQGINQVVRGVDLFASTPRQVYLHQLLDWPLPDYLHLPLILAADGEKLSKQTGAAPVDQLDPSNTLYRLLSALNHPPPTELNGAPPAELLAWAVAHWQIKRLPKQTAML